MELVEGDIVLRPIKLRDQRVWREVNRRNRDWLRPWEATIPPPAPSGPIAHRPTYRQMVRHLRTEAHAGRMLPFVIEYQGRLVGQLTVAGITWGSDPDAEWAETQLKASRLVGLTASTRDGRTTGPAPTPSAGSPPPRLPVGAAPRRPR